MQIYPSNWNEQFSSYYFRHISWKSQFSFGHFAHESASSIRCLLLKAYSMHGISVQTLISQTSRPVRIFDLVQWKQNFSFVFSPLFTNDFFFLFFFAMKFDFYFSFEICKWIFQLLKYAYWVFWVLKTVKNKITRTEICLATPNSFVESVFEAALIRVMPNFVLTEAEYAFQHVKSFK